MSHFSSFNVIGMFDFSERFNRLTQSKMKISVNRLQMKHN